MQLFWRKGFEATSIADLTAAMGIGAPSLYAAFGSKEALYAEALCHYQKNYGPLTWGRFDAAPTAKAAVEQLLMDSAAALTGGDAGAPKGCMVTLSAMDRDEHAELCETVRNSRSAMVERLVARFTRAAADGEIPEDTDLQALARYLQSVQSGMSILARDGASRSELEAVARVAMASWDATVRA
jgi:AcrR family transcriptional regulator